MRNSKKRIAVITGAGSGIGFETSWSFIEKEAWKVIRVDRKFNDFLLYDIHCNVAESKEVKNLFTLVQKQFGRLDLLVNCAGIHLAEPVTETTDEGFERIAGTNIRGVFLCTRAAIPLMLSTGGGVIVNISSDAGIIPDPEAPLYSASKAWVIQFSKALAVAWGRKGVRVNCICPGAVDTPFLRNAFGNDSKAIEDCARLNPMGRLARPEEIAVVINNIVENPYINGAVWNIDGGYSWMVAPEPPKA